MTPTIKASELVKYLQDAIEEHGDLDVRLPFEGEDNKNPLDCAGVVVLDGEDGLDPFFMVCHNSLLDTLPVEGESPLTH